MAILSGYEKYKRHLKVDDENYKLVSEWTHADTVEMTDGKSLSDFSNDMTNNLSDITNNLNNCIFIVSFDEETGTLVTRSYN